MKDKFIIVTGASAGIGRAIAVEFAKEGAIMGVGSVQRFSKVRWRVAGNIVAAWILTFPVCGLIAFIIAKILSL